MIYKMINDLLVVEDDKELLLCLSEIFRLDFKVYQAFDGIDAWATFNKNRPKIVVTDVVMPRMNGIKLVKKIKAIAPSTIVYAISGVNKLQLSHAKKSGADGIFEKPSEMKQLFKNIVNLKKE